jgi:hypothetical protein
VTDAVADPVAASATSDRRLWRRSGGAVTRNVAIARSPVSRPQVAVIMTRTRSSHDANPWAGICCIARRTIYPGSSDAEEGL